MNSLAFIDVVLGSLGRDGPSRFVATMSRADATRISEYASILAWRGPVPSQHFPGLMEYCIDSIAEPVHALKLARSGLEALYDSEPKVIQFPPETQLSALKAMLNWPMSSFVQFGKYWTVYPLAKHLRKGADLGLPEVYTSHCFTELPAVPAGFKDHPLLYTGAIRRLLKSRINSRPSARTWHLLVTILQGVKRGAEVVPPSFIRSAMVKHRRTLLRPDVFDWAELTMFDEYATRFFRNMPKPRFTILEASTSASLESVRSRGGAREEVRRKTRVVGARDRRSTLPTSEGAGSSADMGGAEGTPCCDVWTNYLYGMYEVAPGEVASVMTDIDVTDLAHVVELGFKKYASAGRVVCVQVAAVLEPLKVRLITKSEAIPTWLSRWFQRAMWDYMQACPQFTLTGRTLDKSDLYALLEREKFLGLKLPLWVSGDYAGATDSLKQVYSTLVFDRAVSSCGLDEREAALVQKLIHPQRVSYPERYEKPVHRDPSRWNSKFFDLEEFLQTRGQLMGSTMSFPILCVVNLITYWSALEDYLGHKVNVKDLPVLVNGDDILFRADPRLYDLWRRRVSEVGFEFSLGKNYVHPTFLCINSTSYRYHDGKFEEVPFLNIGLLTGQHKLMAGAVSETRPLDQSYGLVMGGASDKPRAHRRFMHYNAEAIRQATSSGLYNAFSSPHLGGLGFQTYDGVDFTMTGFQRKLGSFLWNWQTSPFEGVYEPTRTNRSVLLQEVGGRLPSYNKKVWGTFQAVSADQPLRANQTEVPDTKVSVGVLGGSLLRSEKPTMVYRPLPRAILRAMRQDQCRLLTKDDICHRRVKWVKVTPEVNIPPALPMSEFLLPT